VRIALSFALTLLSMAVKVPADMADSGRENWL
jgi:hypothetical protein